MHPSSTQQSHAPDRNPYQPHPLHLPPRWQLCHPHQHSWLRSRHVPPFPYLVAPFSSRPAHPRFRLRSPLATALPLACAQQPFPVDPRLRVLAADLHQDEAPAPVARDALPATPQLHAAIHHPLPQDPDPCHQAVPPLPAAPPAPLRHVATLPHPTRREPRAPAREDRQQDPARNAHLCSASALLPLRLPPALLRLLSLARLRGADLSYPPRLASGCPRLKPSLTRQMKQQHCRAERPPHLPRHCVAAPRTRHCSHGPPPHQRQRRLGGAGRVPIPSERAAPRCLRFQSKQRAGAAVTPGARTTEHVSACAHARARRRCLQHGAG